MKLLYLHQYFTFPETNGGTRSYDLATQFAKQGVDVTIVTSSSKIQGVDCSQRWTYLEREGVKFWILRCEYAHSMSIPRRILSFFEFVFFTVFKILKLDADQLLATSTPLTIVIPAIIKKKIAKTPFIFEVRDVWPEGPIQQGYVKNKLLIKLLRKSEHYIYKQADYLVPLSVGMQRDILSRYQTKKIEVIPNISELERFKDLSHKVDIGIDLKGKKAILYAGTFGPVNDLMYVAFLAEKTAVLDKSIIFILIGNGKQKEEIKHYCMDKGLLNSTLFILDSIPKQSLPYLYNQVTMGSSFVWDYKIKWDNSANKVFDTLAAGKPLLINYQGWQAEMIQKKQCGFVLSPELSDKEVNLFVDYINNTDLISESSERALEVAKEFSLPVAVKKYMKIFNSIDDGKKTK